MLVPDQSHIDRICEALWRHSGSGASLMVGSGFSKSALKTRPDAKDLPIWSDVAREVADTLYPRSDSLSDQNGAAEPRATEGLLRLAQEYETAFGRSDLHSLLRRLVRDDDFTPGPAHTRLLRLPWRDVFTTNWDTLLERTTTSVPSRAYSIVRNMGEIPLADRPRIVKLHGSFPSHFPLIFTEEDYRTYPTKFAPFVNTVQQTMMETVLCLIGFSGDDPNFLHWSGWVRDNLGVAAPKIYLAGWLNLSSHRRRMLEERNVVPIDLARHPKAPQWPTHLRHHYSTDWILHTLERGRPYDVTEWPSPRTQRPTVIPDHLQPVHQARSDDPKSEYPEGPGPESQDSERVKQIIDIWAHNRVLYPGWLAVPASTRGSLSPQTDEWEPHILQALSGLKPVEQLNALRELVWRREILLSPISPELESAAESALKLINCQTETIDDVHDATINWTFVREAWQTIALALVTAARHRFARDIFDLHVEALSPFIDHVPDVYNRICHERCLWAAYEADFDTLESLLDDWQPDNSDPMWMVRKAAILVDADRIDEAVVLSNRALSIIRSVPDDGRSLASLSREGWALWLAWALENRFFTARDENEPDWSSIRRRWRELAYLKCDAFSEKHEVARAAEVKGKRPDGPLFDLGARPGKTISFSNEEYHRWVAARRAVLLSEVGGLTTSTFAVASDILKLAADELATTEPEMAARLTLRILNYDKDPLLNRVLSRARVAGLSADTAKALAESCNHLIEYALPRMGKPHAVSWIERLRVAIEMLSRLVLRLEPDAVETTLVKAIEYYRVDHVAHHPWLTEPIGNLLRRCWEALPKAHRTSRFLDLLSAPMVGLDGFTAFSSHYLDPGQLVDEDLVPSRTDDDGDQWHQVVGLVTRGLQAGGEARKRASLRLVPLVQAERLTENESSQIAQALWSEEHTKLTGLPEDTHIFDWAFLLFPEPKPGLAEQRFRHNWLVADQPTQENAPKADGILQQVGTALSGLRFHQRPLALSQDEQSRLIGLVEQWADETVPHHAFPFEDARLRNATVDVLTGLRTVICEVRIPESIGEKLYNKAQRLNELGIPGFTLIPGLIQAMPDRLDELALLMRIGLASENSVLAEGATVGLHHWLVWSNGAPSPIQPPPTDLVREIGVLIATRRRGPLGHALQTAKWVFDEGTAEQQKAMRDLLLQGLGYLAEELRYDKERDQEDDDMPFLRWRSVQLALSMAKGDAKDAPAVARWLQIIEQDPLPEVRYMTTPALVRQPEKEGES